MSLCSDDQEHYSRKPSVKNKGKNEEKPKPTENKEDEIELSKEDEEEIEKKVEDAHDDIVNTLEETEINVKGVTISLITSIIFIVLCIQLNPVEHVAMMARTIKSYYEVQKFSDKPEKFFADISNEAELDKYVRHIVLPLYDSRTINNFNYLLGMRFSLKHANLVENPYDEYSEAVPLIKENANMKPNKKNSGERTSDMGLWIYHPDQGYEKACLLYTSPSPRDS